MWKCRVHFHDERLDREHQPNPESRNVSWPELPKVGDVLWLEMNFSRHPAEDGIVTAEEWAVDEVEIKMVQVVGTSGIDAEVRATVILVPLDMFHRR